MSNPPIVRPVLSRGRPGGLLTPRCRCRESLAETLKRSARRLQCVCAYTLQMSRGSHCNFERHSATVSHWFGHHIDQASSCARHRQGSSLRSDPLRGPAGLDDACAQLEGSTYVMAEEARRIFRIDPSSGRRIVKISSVPSRTLSAVASDAERCSHRPQGNVAASLQ